MSCERSGVVQRMINVRYYYFYINTNIATVGKDTFLLLFFKL